MKRALLSALFAVVFVVPSLAQEAKQDFTLSNSTGYELKEIYVSPANVADWQNDVLGSGTLGDNETVDIKFNRSTRTCKWDLKVVYTIDSSIAVWQNIDLCVVEKITIRYNKNTDKTSASFD